MRMEFAPGSFVEAAVTLAAAVLMTVAGFEMLQRMTTSPQHELAGPARPADVTVPRKLDDPAPYPVAMPQVDHSRA